MGKGDGKSKKGKISKHSFGVSRPHKQPTFKAVVVAATPAVKEVAKKK